MSLSGLSKIGSHTVRTADSSSPLSTSAEPYRVLEDKQSEALRSEGLEQALQSLDARSRRIIEARWLREKDTATLHDLAAEFKVSAERIRQIESKAMEKMRKHISAPAARALPAPA